MPLDHWRLAHNRAVQSQADGEYAAFGRSSYPHVWTEADLEPVAITPEPMEIGCRRQAIWVVVDRRGQILARFAYAKKLAADEHARNHTRQTAESATVVLAKVPIMVAE